MAATTRSTSSSVSFSCSSSTRSSSSFLQWQTLRWMKIQKIKLQDFKFIAVNYEKKGWYVKMRWQPTTAAAYCTSSLFKRSQVSPTRPILVRFHLIWEPSLVMVDIHDCNLIGLAYIWTTIANFGKLSRDNKTMQQCSNRESPCLPMYFACFAIVTTLQVRGT